MDVANGVVRFLEQSLSKHPPPWHFALSDFQAFTLSLNSSISAPLALPNNFTIFLDSAFLLANEDCTLRLAFIRYNIYLNVTASDERTAAPLAVVSVEKAGAIINISNLASPFHIEFPLDLRIPQIQQLVDDVHSTGAKTEAEALSEGLLSCKFYD